MEERPLVQQINKYLVPTVPGMVLDTRDTAVNKTESLPLLVYITWGKEEEDEQIHI